MRKSNQPTALTLLRQRQQRAANPTQREIKAVNHFHDVTAPVTPWDEMNFDAVLEVERPKRVQWEHIEQVKVVQWFDRHCHEYDLPYYALFAVPNAGQRGIINGKNLKAEGMRAGAPDLMLMVSRGDSLCLAVEMKPIRGGTWDAEQKEFCTYLQGQGYRYELCHGADAAIQTIKEYLA